MATIHGLGFRGHPQVYSNYNHVKVPEGYFLRHHETGSFKDLPPRRGVVLANVKNGYYVADVEEMKDHATDSWIFSVVFRKDGIPVKKFHGRDLGKVFITACAYHRLTSTSKG